MVGATHDVSKPAGVSRWSADRFESVGWGLLFILVGALALPRGTAEFVAVAAAGTAMLVLNAIRLAVRVPVSWFGVALGSVALAAGVGALVGISVPAFALLFILLGLGTIVGAIVRAR